MVFSRPTTQVTGACRLLAPDKPGPGPVQHPVKQVLHLAARGEQQVAAVFGLVDRVVVAEPAHALLGEVEAEAQASRVDPPVADLAQAPYSRLARQGICDPGQAAIRSEEHTSE